MLVFDRPGFGLTSRPLRGEWTAHDQDPYTLEAAADQTISLMDHVGMTTATLVAHSAGCAVAVTTAARYPRRIAALLLEDPAVTCTRMAPNWLGPVLRSGPARHVGPKLTGWASAHTGERSLKRALHNPDLITPEVKAGYWEPLSDERWAPRCGSMRPPREPSKPRPSGLARCSDACYRRSRRCCHPVSLQRRSRSAGAWRHDDHVRGHRSRSTRGAPQRVLDGRESVPRERAHRLSGHLGPAAADFSRAEDP